MAMRLADELLTLGVRPGGVLMVHASLRSLGPEGSAARGGAEGVVAGLREALTADGTLLMPALSYQTVTPQNPVFDVRSTPTCVGALAEYFRTRPETLRSVHPTHSVCGVGRRAEEILSHHIQDTTPCGENSPFARLSKIGGQVLFIGCGLKYNTTMHAVEEHVKPPYLFGEPVTYQITLADGTQTSMTVVTHNFKGWEQRYDKLEGVMQHGLKRGKLLEADCFLLDAAEMWFATLSQMRQDLLFFVERTDGSGGTSEQSEANARDEVSERDHPIGHGNTSGWSEHNETA